MFSPLEKISSASSASHHEKISRNNFNAAIGETKSKSLSSLENLRLEKLLHNGK